MYAKELVGKTCIREKPVMIERYIKEGGGMFYLSSQGERKVADPDYTYCTTPVKIIAATDHNIVCEKDGFMPGGKPLRINLDERYCDDAWVDYEALLHGRKSEKETEAANEP